MQVNCHRYSSIYPSRMPRSFRLTNGENIISTIFSNSKKCSHLSSSLGTTLPMISGRNFPKHHICPAILYKINKNTKKIWMGHMLSLSYFNYCCGEWWPLSCKCCLTFLLKAFSIILQGLNGYRWWFVFVIEIPIVKAAHSFIQLLQCKIFFFKYKIFENFFALILKYTFKNIMHGITRQTINHMIITWFTKNRESGNTISFTKFMILVD